MSPFFDSLLKFWYTILVVFILGRLIYYRYKGKREYLFSYILMAAIIFFLCMLIRRAELSIGFAFGLFAVFTIMRYRTVPIPTREMTYIFLSVGIAAKNALAPDEIEFIKIVSTDFSILILAAVAEYFLFKKYQITKEIVYNDLNLIHPNKRRELYHDLDRKFGISNIEELKIGKIDTVKNSVRLIIKFRDRGENNADDGE